MYSQVSNLRLAQMKKEVAKLRNRWVVYTLLIATLTFLCGAIFGIMLERTRVNNSQKAGNEVKQSTSYPPTVVDYHHI